MSGDTIMGENRVFLPKVPFWVNVHIDQGIKGYRFGPWHASRFEADHSPPAVWRPAYRICVRPK